MRDIDKDLQEMRLRMKDGSIQSAYQEILSYMGKLKAAAANQWGPGTVGGIYQGHLDISFFALSPKALKLRNLKLPILFNYETFSFDIWLSARNRQIQTQYWNLLLGSGFNKFPLIEPAPCETAIIKQTLLTDYSFKEEDDLTAKILAGIGTFEFEIVDFLQRIDPQ